MVVDELIPLLPSVAVTVLLVDLPAATIPHGAVSAEPLMLETAGDAR